MMGGLAHQPDLSVVGGFGSADALAELDRLAPGRGSALTPSDRAQLVTQLARLGADFARTHYPPHPALLDRP